MNSTPWRRDAGSLEVAIQAWARSFRGDNAILKGIKIPDSGMANDTVMVMLDGEPLVARLAPHPESPYPTFPRFDLRFQERVMELVRERTDVPVPEIVHLEESDEYFGAPFLVMRCVEGNVPSDNPPYLMDPMGWFLQGSAADWRRFEESTIDVLARLHRVIDDGESTAFLHLDQPGGTPLARQLAYQRDYYEWGRDGRSIPVLERALTILESTLPDNEAAVLNWGDSRPGNIIYEDFEPVAVLDWEMAGVGPAEVDVAWTTFFQQFFTSLAEQFGLPAVPPMFGSETTVAAYERLSGVTLERLAWYEAFAGLRFAIILARMNLRGIAFDQQVEPKDPNELVLFAPLLERLLDEI
jgi:aminoglycoside phosphotransferase (APT) family kinase protein